MAWRVVLVQRMRNLSFWVNDRKANWWKYKRKLSCYRETKCERVVAQLATYTQKVVAEHKQMIGNGE